VKALPEHPGLAVAWYFVKENEPAQLDRVRRAPGKTLVSTRSLHWMGKDRNAFQNACGTDQSAACGW